MTPAEAGTVLTIIAGGSVQSDRDRELLKVWMEYLERLPYEPIRSNVERYMLGVGDDGKPRFITTLTELLVACGIPEQRRDLVMIARRDGGNVYRDLRDTWGWTYVRPGDPKPDGVVEAEVHLRQLEAERRGELPALQPPPMPAPLALTAGAPVEVPPIPVDSAAAARAVGERIAEIVRSHTVSRRRERTAKPTAELTPQLAAELDGVDERFRAELERATRRQA